MKHSIIINETINFVKKTLENAESGHDWFHIERVLINANKIVENEDVDPFIVTLGTLLHDIADSKFYNGDESIGPKKAMDFLKQQKVDDKTINHIINIIKHISFKNSFDKNTKPFTSKELEVIQDADRLDAIGAIGIARAFNYGGFKNRKIYDPSIPANHNMTKEEYKKSEGPTINHFYEKLLLLKDMMNTETGKRMAEERHTFMLQFLEQFYKEVGNLQ